jgi:hypothetical protein
VLFYLLEGLLARLGLNGLIAGAFKIDDDEAANARFVLKNKNLFHLSAILPYNNFALPRLM